MTDTSNAPGGAPPIDDERIMAEDIVHFVAQDLLYFAITAHGDRLDIIRSSAIQPPIADQEEYASYLWIETTISFFVLRQVFRGGLPQGWTIIREIVPSDRFNFFTDAVDWLRERLSHPVGDDEQLFRTD